MVKFTEAAFVTLSFLLACSTAVSGAARKARHAPAYNRGDYEEAYDEPADYKFAWYALATGPAGGYDGGAYGGGGYGQEPKYGGAATAAQFGHTESRYGDQTQGKYFVQLPNGLLQTVDYKVDDNSGYVATVSYSDGAAGGGYAGGNDAGGDDAGRDNADGDDASGDNAGGDDASGDDAGRDDAAAYPVYARPEQ